MSTAALSAQPAAGVGGYSIARSHGKCTACARDIAPGEKYIAAVRESDIGLERLDLDTACWEKFERSALLAFWQTTLPTAATQKPKVFVDDSVLCELFERLDDVGEEPGKVNFRFVLGLILMRKRLLSYESTHVQGNREFWTVRLKGREQPIDLVNPRLDEAQVAEVSAQLGQILNGESA